MNVLWRSGLTLILLVFLEQEFVVEAKALRLDIEMTMVSNIKVDEVVDFEIMEVEVVDFKNRLGGAVPSRIAEVEPVYPENCMNMAVPSKIVKALVLTLSNRMDWAVAFMIVVAGAVVFGIVELEVVISGVVEALGN